MSCLWLDKICSPRPVQYVPAWHRMHVLLLMAPVISTQWTPYVHLVLLQCIQFPALLLTYPGGWTKTVCQHYIPKALEYWPGRHCQHTPELAAPAQSCSTLATGSAGHVQWFTRSILPVGQKHDTPTILNSRMADHWWASTTSCGLLLATAAVWGNDFHQARSSRLQLGNGYTNLEL